MNFKNKIFLFPLSLAVILFASIIIIFSPVGKKNIINPSSLPWQTFTGKNFDISFRYPSFYKVVETNKDIVVYDTQNKVIDPDTQKLVEPNIIAIIPISKSDYTSSYKEFCSFDAKFTLGQNEFIPCQEGYGMPEFYSNNFIIISLSPNKIDQSDPVFSQILSTFKFIQK